MIPLKALKVIQAEIVDTGYLKKFGLMDRLAMWVNILAP